jgi:peptide deformylase
MPQEPADNPLDGLKFESLQVVIWPDPRLLKMSRPVTVFDDRLRQFAARMTELMHKEDGVGLAAPQVGVNLRLFVASPTGKPEDDKVYVNPVLSDEEGEEEAEEGCLSLPEIRIKVVRPTKRVRIQAQDLSGQPFEQAGEGFVTRVWQHETDHLNGVLILNWMGPVAKMQHRKQLKALEEEYEARQKPKKRPPPKGFPF